MPYWFRSLVIAVVVLCAMGTRADAVFDTKAGRWLQRDPAEYDAGSMSLYEYASDSPVVRHDALGLADVTCCSGLNSHGENYVRERLNAMRPGSVPAAPGPYDRESMLSSSRGCPLGGATKAGYRNVLMFSKQKLDQEAQNLGSDPSIQGGFCGGGTTSVELVMYAPRTQTLPGDVFAHPSSDPSNAPHEHGCCNIRITVMANPHDSVPHQELLFQPPDTIWNEWGEYIPADTGSGSPCDSNRGHCLPGYLRTVPGLKYIESSRACPGGRWARTGKQVNGLDLLDRAVERAGPTGRVMTCHSQGCNIAMQMLRGLCNDCK